MTKEELKKWLEEICKAYKLRLEAVKTLEKLAKDAQAANDEKDFDIAKAGGERESKLPTMKEVDDNFSNFGQGDPALKKIRDMIADLNKQVEAVLARLKKMVFKIDYKKLAQALKIDKCPKADDKLEKALKLQGGARKKALEALQAECKVKFSSKDMDTLMKN